MNAAEFDALHRTMRRFSGPDEHRAPKRAPMNAARDSRVRKKRTVPSSERDFSQPVNSVIHWFQWFLQERRRAPTVKVHAARVIITRSGTPKKPQSDVWSKHTGIPISAEFSSRNRVFVRYLLREAKSGLRCICQRRKIHYTRPIIATR